MTPKEHTIAHRVEQMEAALRDIQKLAGEATLTAETLAAFSPLTSILILASEALGRAPSVSGPKDSKGAGGQPSRGIAADPGARALEEEPQPPAPAEPRTSDACRVEVGIGLPRDCVRGTVWCTATHERHRPNEAKLDVEARVGLHADCHPHRGWALVINGHGYPMPQASAEALEKILRLPQPDEEPRSETASAAKLRPETLALCDMIAFRSSIADPSGRLIDILKRTVNFIEGQECWEPTETGGVEPARKCPACFAEKPCPSQVCEHPDRAPLKRFVER